MQYTSIKPGSDNYSSLAEMPGVARDSIRNEGIREINYGIVVK
jgi:hypothetical protein